MKHVVALSGGKDSTAMALRLAEIEPRDYIYVCTPTGDEPPAMFEHWRKLGDLLGAPILPIMADTLINLIKRQNALPNWRQRWCTRLYQGGGFSSPLFDGFDNVYVGQPGAMLAFPPTQWIRWRRPVIVA